MERQIIQSFDLISELVSYSYINYNIFPITINVLFTLFYTRFQFLQAQIQESFEQHIFHHS